MADHIDTDAVRGFYAHDVLGVDPGDLEDLLRAFCDEVDRLRAKVAEQRTLISEIAVERERLRAALEEEFDFDRLPIPRFVNCLIDIWHEGDGYDPGDEYEVTEAVHRCIRQATEAERRG